MTIKVLISGSGKMGREVLHAVSAQNDMEPVGVVDLLSTEEYISLPGEDGVLVPFERDPSALITRTRPDVIVDFTSAEWTPKLAEAALEGSVRLVSGTSGLSESFVSHLGKECAKQELGSVVASNFAIGAILMQQMSRMAARFYDHVEIVEQHHDGKVDAPSGTSLATAKAIVDAHGKPMSATETKRETIQGTRGGVVDGVAIHSVRLPGLVAHQEVIFGGTGETLRIRHDTSDRASFMPGVLLAVREVMNLKSLVVGLEGLFGFESEGPHSAADAG
ncbi:MAG: 4-hydroxy-tetrahydrodipicolinate reductase [Chloroflexi bacterium]|nr:4-hydroxy-tetrahydrodipicolinate reductase [Chloroflexota bacterium]MCI0784462.1 4-hydroxy-tetrahydrodipicolinate reductase [Chloroflexota bacterium]MCI0818636.1 4-hydroxy-tetrahydrodipicolinate reductase [Chloroflexota bacterium]MCI0819790.1 4-hydroxy-tetrahydrodipicolinate reductase [Chloroflexota bacterium]MCI0838630.1 4-hydroxy-tetrahydrodipicolinate reductase [Chloroflexota bacterium]